MKTVNDSFFFNSAHGSGDLYYMELNSDGKYACYSTKNGVPETEVDKTETYNKSQVIHYIEIGGWVVSDHKIPITLDEKFYIRTAYGNGGLYLFISDTFNPGEYDCISVSSDNKPQYTMCIGRWKENNIIANIENGSWVVFDPSVNVEPELTPQEKAINLIKNTIKKFNETNGVHGIDDSICELIKELEEYLALLENENEAD